MGEALSFLSFLVSIVAVVLAAVAFVRVEGRLAEENRLLARKNYELQRIAAQNQAARRVASRPGGFSEEDLAAPEPRSREGAGEDARNYPNHPSRKSIEMAMDLDRKRQEARRLALEAGLTVVEEETDEGRSFSPSIRGRSNWG